jgi:hypothetical protein
MKIQYKIVEYEDSQVVLERSREGEEPCCDEMSRLLSKQIVRFDPNEPVLYVSPSEECDYEDHSTIDLRFCPFCGKEIELSLAGRIRRIKKKRTVTREEVQYYYEDQPLPI